MLFKISAGGSTEISDSKDWVTIDRLYFHINKYFILSEWSNVSETCRFDEYKKLGISSPVSCLSFQSVPRFLENVKVGWVDGVSLMIDFPDVDRVSNMAYWFEIVGRVRGHVVAALEQAVRENNGETLPFKHVIIRNLLKKDVQKYPWIMELLSVAVKPAALFHKGLKPKLWFIQDIGRDFQQWVGFQRVILLKRDKKILKGDENRNIFVSREIARSFREDVRKEFNVSFASPPRDITLILSADDAGIFNAGEVLRLLHGYKNRLGGRAFYVRPYSPTLGVPIESFARRMAQTRILVARHTSHLGYSLFLQPGSIVIELLPRNYDSFDSFYIYRELSRSMGDILHWVVPANGSDAAVFQSERDERYAAWLPGECYAKDCAEAHEMAEMVVDVSLLRSMLDALVQVGLENVSSHDASGLFNFSAPSKAKRIQANAGLVYEDEE